MMSAHRHPLLALGCCLSLVLLLAMPTAAAAPAIQSSAAVLMDAETGTILLQRNAHERRAVASTTKIMTGLLALENANLDDFVTVGPAVTEVTGSAVYLQPGDVVRMDDLVTAVLLKSANDAAVAVAEHISGSVPAFAARMNERARELGATDTHFVNPHGLHEADHYSSAYDLALITQEALKHPRFQELVSTKSAAVSLPSGVVNLDNHNKLLWRADFVDGVKTGFVNQSGQCLVASGTKDGWQLIGVVLNSPDTYGEALSLLDHGFSEYRKEVFARPGDALGEAPVRGGTERSVPALCRERLAAVSGPGLPSEPRLEVSFAGPLRAPVAAGDRVGEARVVAAGRVLAICPLFAGEAVARSLFLLIGTWALRGLLLVAVAALLVRTYAKAVKGHRGRRASVPPQGG